MGEVAILRVIGALALVLLLVLLCGWLAKRSGLSGAAGKASLLRISSRMSLGARSSIVIVDVPQARLVLGVTPNSINLLHTLPADTASAQDSSPAGQGQQPLTFKRIFQQARTKDVEGSAS